MVAKQFPARNMIFEVEDTSGGTPTWKQIGQLTEFTVNYSENEESADTTTFESDGMHESRAMQRGAILELTSRKATATDGTGTDPGQEHVEVMADKVLDASVGRFRFRHERHTEWKVWDAWFTLGEQTGGNNNMISWAATVHRTGPSTTMPVQ